MRYLGGTKPQPAPPPPSNHAPPTPRRRHQHACELVRACALTRVPRAHRRAAAGSSVPPSRRPVRPRRPPPHCLPRARTPRRRASSRARAPRAWPSPASTGWASCSPPSPGRAVSSGGAP
eukprot:6213489-Pleurochrysis_carterae.AAC.5